MSDDMLLGNSCCCINRRLFAGLLAALFLVYGALQCLMTVIAYIHDMSTFSYGSRHECFGLRCSEFHNCHGMQQATFNIRWALLVFGGVVFGCWGLCGSLFKHPSQLLRFAGFAASIAVLHIIFVVCDALFFAACRSYPTNVIEMALLWCIPGLPVSQGVKHELTIMPMYPLEHVRTLTGVPVFGIYILFNICWVLFFSYTASEIMRLALRIHYGLVGLGANYSIESWRDRLYFKHDLNNRIRITRDMAFATDTEVDWRPAEFGGLMPGQPQYGLLGLQTPMGMGGDLKGNTPFEFLGYDRRAPQGPHGIVL